VFGQKYEVTNSLFVELFKWSTLFTVKL
jgi:hypothetical protein